MITDARFSPCGRYRWWLQRCWDCERPPLLFVGLNPSRADADRDDPTLRRLQDFARSWGYGRLEVLNLFARISPSPSVLRRSSEPVGAENDLWLQERVLALASVSGALWLGWGNGGAWCGRDQQVLSQLACWARVPGAAAFTVPWLSLGLTAAGQPRHPLYVPGDARPVRLLHSGAKLCAAPPVDGPYTQSLCHSPLSGGRP